MFEYQQPLPGSLAMGIASKTQSPKGCLWCLYAARRGVDGTYTELGVLETKIGAGWDSTGGSIRHTFLLFTLP